MKKSKNFIKDLLSVFAICITVFVIIFANPKETINVIDKETASQRVNSESKEVQVNFRCRTDEEFATFLNKFMLNNKDLNIEKIDSSNDNEFDVTFSRIH